MRLEAQGPYHCRCQQQFRFRAHGPNIWQWFRQGSYRFVSCSWCPISLEPAHEATAWSSYPSFEQGWQFDRNMTREAGSGCDNTRVNYIQVRISICVALQPQVSARRPISASICVSRLILSAALENLSQPPRNMASRVCSGPTRTCPVLPDAEVPCQAYLPLPRGRSITRSVCGSYTITHLPNVYSECFSALFIKPENSKSRII